MSEKEMITTGDGKYLLYRMTGRQVGLWLGDERYTIWADSKGALLVLKQEPAPWESEQASDVTEGEKK